MERDFLGLGTAKEEATEGSKDSGPMRGSGMQWSFSSKPSAIPQFLSFKPPQDEKPRKTVNEPTASSGFMSISAADVFDSNQKPYSGTAQKNMILDKQAGNYHAKTNYSIQHFDAYRVNQQQEMRTFPISNQQNQPIAISVSGPALKSHFVSTGHNLVVNPMISQSVGGVSIANTVPVLPNTSSIVGTTDLRYGNV
uniref:Protein TIFY 6B n=1 Tax=Rhizophora mucronata TaxID=61149 RepID=A0A2P2K949_RHIMU